MQKLKSINSQAPVTYNVLSDVLENTRLSEARTCARVIREWRQVDLVEGTPVLLEDVDHRGTWPHPRVQKRSEKEFNNSLGPI